MTNSTLKLYVSLGVVLSHLGVFFGVVMLRALVLPQADMIEIVGAMVPLFAVFLVVIVKDTLRGREDLSLGNVQTQQMILLTFVILGAYIFSVIATFAMIISQTLAPADLPRWLSMIESAFGIALGLIIDELFGGKGGAVREKQ